MRLKTVPCQLGVDGADRIPSTMDSLLCPSVFHACATTGFGQTHSFLSYRNHDATSLIDRLFCQGGPLAVLRRVISVVVYTFDGSTVVWPRPHISEKYRKVMPLIADRYPSSAIIRVWAGIFILAARQHARPTYILRRRWLETMTRLAMRQVPCAHHFLLNTLAAFRSITKIIGRDDCLIPAFALTEPTNNPPFSVLRPRDNRQFTVGLSSSIDKIVHAVSVILASGNGKRKYQCEFCKKMLLHCEARGHWDECPKRLGATVKAPTR